MVSQDMDREHMTVFICTGTILHEYSLLDIASWVLCYIEVVRK